MKIWDHFGGFAFNGFYLFFNTSKFPFRRNGFKIKLRYTINRDKARELAMRKGKFILVSNLLDFDKHKGREILQAYWGQSHAERNFKVLKDKTFSLSQVYLKRADRITSLICLMVLTLFVNNFGEYILRKKLIRKNLTIKNQLGKDIRKPTFRWILERFQKIVLVKLSLGKQTREIVCNIDQEHVALIKCLGKTAQTFY